MAVLQAARARALGLDINEAKSWGLNRALFYAAAKRGWANARAVGTSRPVIGELELSRLRGDREYRLGGEKSYLAPDIGVGLRFRFGDEVQLPEEFDQQVRADFNDWGAVWREAEALIQAADPLDLESQHRFYDHVYKPRRDLLAERWDALPKPRRQARRAA
jgi:hypothetical protein